MYGRLTAVPAQQTTRKSQRECLKSLQPPAPTRITGFPAHMHPHPPAPRHMRGPITGRLDTSTTRRLTPEHAG